MPSEYDIYVVCFAESERASEPRSGDCETVTVRDELERELVVVERNQRPGMF